MSERDLSVNVSMGSMTSERQVRLSGMSTQSNDYEFGGNDDNDGNLSTDTMDLDDEPNDAAARLSKKSSKSKSALMSKKSQEPAKSATSSKSALTTPAPAAPKPNSARYSKFSTASSPAPSHDFNMSTSFDTGSAMKSIPIPMRREKQDLGSIKRLIARKSLQSMSPSRITMQRGSDGGVDSGSDSATKSDGKRKRDSFGEGAGFDEVSSPFSLGGDPVSPMSNGACYVKLLIALPLCRQTVLICVVFAYMLTASERNLDSIKFSNKKSTDSPNIRVKLFKGDKFGSTRVANDDEKPSKKGKGKAATKSAKKAVAKKAPAAKRAKTKTSYKSTPASDESIDQQTDNDNTFNASTSDDALSDGEESDFGESKNSKRAKAHELSYARDIFDDADDEDNDASGVRRSKRRRFKPLAWYKGEHYIYERRESGVGLVIPTVAGIERAGTSTPTKTARKYTKRVGAQRKSVKAFPKAQLPKDLKYEKGEWADLYDTSAGCINKMNVICRASEIEHRELPSVDGEQPGFAGQSFNLRSSHPFSRWICGRLGLPPGAAKEAESVGDAVQVFYVTNCQPQAVEVSFGPVTDEYFDTAKATRFLLNPGDEFYVPSRNAYYLKNYSEKATCDLHFTIMKPDLPPTVVSSSEAAAGRDSESPNFGDAKSENVSDRRAKKQQKRLKP